MDMPKIKFIDPNTEPIKIDPSEDKLFGDFVKDIEIHISRWHDMILERKSGEPMPKPYFQAERKDFSKVYECDEYKCDAHPRGCLFCKHSTDIFWDYTHGPYCIVCEKAIEAPVLIGKGFIGECELFEDDI